jgi:hypothetical protein
VARYRRPPPNASQKKMSKDEELQLAAIIVRDRRKAQRDLKHYIQEHVRIEDKDLAGTEGGIVSKFTLWPLQMQALDTILSNRFSIILKARQLGLTWLALAYISHGLLFKPGFTASGISRTEEEAQELVRRMTFILRNMPAWITARYNEVVPDYLWPTWDGNKQELLIFHKDPITKQPLETSRFRAATSSPNSARSFTDNVVLLDEWAFQDYAGEIWQAALPTVNRPTGGQVVGISTAKRGTLFEAIWDAATKKEIPFKTVFLPWWADPRRTPEWMEGTRKLLELKRLKGEQVSYHAEYPETPEEAFMFSENTVFDVETVASRIKLLREAYEKEPPLVGNVVCKHTDDGDPIPNTERFEPDPNGQLTIYAMPEKGKPYVISGDTAEGGKDFSAAHVIDNTTGEQVAVWYGHTDTDLYAKMLYSLGYFYNIALIAIETNFDLHPTKELQRLRYPHQYRRETIDRISKRRLKKYGWNTTTASRGPMIGNLVTVVRENPELINDIATLDEMLTFVRNEDGKPEALEGKHDDLVMALAIAHAVRSQQEMALPAAQGSDLPEEWAEDTKKQVMANEQFADYFKSFKERIETQMNAIFRSF